MFGKLFVNNAYLFQKKFSGPGAAVAQAFHTEQLVNGVNYSSASDNEYEPMRRQGSLESRKRPKTLRTRHNSVPCSPESIDCGPETTHSRSPSSPANFNFSKKSLPAEEPSQSEIMSNGTETNFIPEHTISASQDASSVENPPSGSADDFTSGSASTDDDDESGCVVS